MEKFGILLFIVLLLVWSIVPSGSREDLGKLRRNNKRVQHALDRLPKDMKDRLEQGGQNAFKNFTKDMIDRLPSSVFANAGRDALRAMSRDQIKEMAKRVGKGTSTKDLKKILSDVDADQFDNILDDMKNSSKNLSRRQMESFVKQMKSNKGRLSSWSSTEVRRLGKMMKGLSPSELRDLANAGRQTFEASVEEMGKDGVGDLSKGQKKELIKGAVRNYGSQDKWNSDAVKKMARFIPNMKHSDLKKLPISAIMGAVRDLAAAGLDGRSARELMKKMKSKDQGYGRPDTWTADTLKTMGRLSSGLTIKDIKSLNLNAVRGALASLGSARLSRKQARKMASKVKTALGSPETWSAAVIRNASSILRGLKPKDLRKLSIAAIKESLKTIKNIKFSRGQARELAKKMRESLGNPSSWNESTVEDMGPLVGGLPISDLQKMSSKAVKSAFKALKGDDLIPPSKKRAIMKKMRAEGDLKLVEVGSFLKTFSLKDLENIDIERDLGLSNATNSTGDADRAALPWKLSQARKVLRKIKDKWGNPADSASDWTLENIAHLKGLAIGIWKELVGNMSDYDFPDIVEEFAGQKGFTTGQRRIIVKAYKKKLLLEKPENFSSMTEESVASLGNFTMELDKEDLENLPSDGGAEAVRQIGGADVTKQPRELIKRRVLTALKLLGKARGLVRSVTPGELTSDELLDLGNLIVGFTTAEIDQLDSDSFKAAVHSVGQTEGFDKNQLRKLAEKAKEAYKGAGSAVDAPSLLSDTDVSDLGIIMAGFTKEDFQKMTKERVDDNIDYLGTLPLDREQAQGILDKTTQAKRKRRATDLSGKTGDELIAMGNTLLALTAGDITTVTNTAYDEAAVTIGGIQGFSQEQLQAWAAKAKEAWNTSVSQFSSEQLLRVGMVAVGFTASDLGKMVLNTDDVIESLGSQRLRSSDSAGYTSSQLSSALGQIKTLKNKAISAFTGDELAALKNFALAMTSAEIGSIATAEFAIVVGPLGSLSGWSEAQMTQLKQRAVTVYGAVSSWSAEELRESGAAIGGITSSELQSFSSDHVSMISPSAISQMPVSLFKEFTTSQLQAFDPIQAATVTTDQWNALPLDKQNILNDKKGKATISDSESGAGQLHFSLTSVSVLIFSALLLYFQYPLTVLMTRVFMSML